MNNNPRTNAPWRVLIIGSGFAGLGLAMQLRRAGEEDFLLLEQAAEVGGTWRDNSYPGAACDVPSYLYSFSFEPKHDWSRKFAPQAEIHAYILQCVAKHRLRPHIRLNSEVLGAEFDAERGLWRVELAGGEVIEAQALVSACGQLNRPAYPKLPGLERFRGEAFHSARWRHDLDLTGKRVAVIGTGASAIQFVPQIQPKVASLSLFQRSAAYVLAKPDRAYRPWEVELMRRVPWLQRGVRLLQRQMPDAGKRAQLQPDYPMGCKRILISNDYFPALAQANVEIVDAAICEVREEALVTADGREHPCDVLIYGTGFTASDFLAPMRIRGLDGLELNQAWQEGAEAYKGISVSGFPNLFLLYGPNTNLGHNSILYMLESQFAYVLGCLKVLRGQGLRYLDIKPAAQRRYNDKLQAETQRTIWAQGCHSWYQTATGKHTNNWPGYTFTYRQQTRMPELGDYDCVR